MAVRQMLDCADAGFWARGVRATQNGGYVAQQHERGAKRALYRVLRPLILVGHYRFTVIP